MAQTNYTPISLYYSITASAAPSAGNLISGELAINITDGKLYYKDNANVIQLLASKAGASGDVVGPASATDTAIAIYDGATGKLIKNSTVTIGSTGNTIISGADNTNAMLRITQTGTGDALLVEDSASTDSSPFVVKADGKVGVGLTGPSEIFEVQGLGSTISDTNIRITNPNTATDSSSCIYFKAAGADRAYISSTAPAGNTTSNGTYNVFTADNTGALVLRHRITSAADVDFWAASAFTVNADVLNTPVSLILASNATARWRLYLDNATNQVNYIGASGAIHIWRVGGGISSTIVMRVDTIGLTVGSGTPPRERITLGTTTSTSTATPESIDMGGTFSNTAGSNLKLKLYNAGGTDIYGIGVSNAQMDYSSPTGTAHAWYVGGTVRARIAGNGFMFNAGNGNTAQGLVPGFLTYALNANFTLVSNTTAQNVFGVATPTLQPGRYRFRTVIGQTKSTGTGTIGFSLGGTATFAYLSAITRVRLGAAFTTVAATNSVTITSTSPTTNTVISGATVAVSNNTITAEGFFDVSVAGTAAFQVTMSAAPGTYSTSRGSFVEVWPVSATGANTNIGGWA
jgi:hypothetical protein